MEVAEIKACSIGVVVIYALLLAISLPAAAAAADVNNAQSPYHAPVPIPSPTSDGTAIDQGIAYVLMLLALVLTYIIH